MTRRVCFSTRSAFAILDGAASFAISRQSIDVAEEAKTKKAAVDVEKTTSVPSASLSSDAKTDSLAMESVPVFMGGVETFAIQSSAIMEVTPIGTREG
uniref:Uncharacterized protein n=1 Tax=Plectus sambesii TaxID=2011161 RepID=A0A914WRW8_9BILA